MTPTTNEPLKYISQRKPMTTKRQSKRKTKDEQFRSPWFRISLREEEEEEIQ